MEKTCLEVIYIPDLPNGLDRECGVNYACCSNLQFWFCQNDSYPLMDCEISGCSNASTIIPLYPSSDFYLPSGNGLHIITTHKDGDLGDGLKLALPVTTLSMNTLPCKKNGWWTPTPSSWFSSVQSGQGQLRRIPSPILIKHVPQKPRSIHLGPFRVVLGTPDA